MESKTMKESIRATFFGILAMIVFLFSHTLLAQTKFYEDRSQGWHWYEKLIQFEQPLDKENASKVTSEQALDELNTLQKELEGAKALAVMYPTTQHIEEYVRLHNTVLQKASLFSSQWQQVIWQTPELDFSIDKPTDNSARHLYYDLEKTIDKQSIQSLVNEYGLFFFFRSSCPYCHEFAPILKNLEVQYGITVMAISLDGGTLPQYMNAVSDNGLAQQLGVEVVPALYALHPQSQQVIPLSFGLVSEAELIRRISTLATAQGRVQ
ncbi:MAG: conjugal transfer protein TraF [Legionellales bacterium]|jgi:conjugal transfer pilus assembly protein TraF